MAKNPFKVGDKVFVYPQGWGVIHEVIFKTLNVEFKVGEAKVYDDHHASVVSFTEYDPIKGGLSHNREDYVVPGSINESKQKAFKEFVDELNEIGRAAENASKQWSVKFGMPFGQVDSHGDVHAKGCFNPDDVSFKIEGHDLRAALERTGRWENEARQDIIPADAAERNLKALKYIKKLLKDDYNVVEDYIGVEDLGSEVNVSLTFRKG